MASPLSARELRDFSVVCSKLRAVFADRSTTHTSVHTSMSLLFDKLYVAAIRSFTEPVDDVIRSSRKDLRRVMRIDPDDSNIPYNNLNLDGKKMRMNKQLARVMAFGRRKPMLSSNVFVQLIYCIVENIKIGSSYGIHSDLELSGVASAWARNPVLFTEYQYAVPTNCSRNQFVQGVLLGGRVLLAESTADLPWTLVDNDTRLIGPDRTLFLSTYVNESGLVLLYGSGLETFRIMDLAPYIHDSHENAGLQDNQTEASTMPQIDFISKYHVFYSVLNLVLKIIYTDSGVQLRPLRKYRRYFKMYKRYGNKRLCNKVYLETRDERYYNFVWNGEIIYSGYLNGGMWQLHTDGLLYNIHDDWVDCVQLHLDFHANKYA